MKNFEFNGHGVCTNNNPRELDLFADYNFNE